MFPPSLPAFLPVSGVTGLDRWVSQRLEGPKAKGAFVGVGGTPSLPICFACRLVGSGGLVGLGVGTARVVVEALQGWAWVVYSLGAAPCAVDGPLPRPL